MGIEDECQGNERFPITLSKNLELFSRIVFPKLEIAQEGNPSPNLTNPQKSRERR